MSNEYANVSFFVLFDSFKLEMLERVPTWVAGFFVLVFC